MPLTLEVELLTGRYEAAGAGDRDHAEWPPHPARVFCALVAGARDEEDRDALRWLERQGPPQVQAGRVVDGLVRRSWVVTNRVRKEGGNQTHVARSNAERRRPVTVPSSASVRFVWTDAEPERRTVEVLDRLARRVPYLGRSTGAALLRVSTTQTAAEPDGLEAYVPAAGEVSPADVLRLRVPYDGYLDALVALHAAGRPAWEDSRSVAYVRAGADGEDGEPDEAPEPSVYTEVVVLRFRGVRPDGRLVARFTQALRRALMAATRDPLPAALHGHGADGRPHVAFLGLPDVGHQHARGHLLGLAVAVPDLPAEERRAIVRGLLLGMRDGEDGALVLRVPDVGEVELEYAPGLVRPWGARPERWRRGSRTWATATPMVLDRFPKDGDVAAEVLRSCAAAGLPRVVDLDVRAVPMLDGAVDLRPADLPARARGRLYRHVRLTFERPVSGPLLLGAGRYLGVGLLAPVVERAETTTAPAAGEGGESQEPALAATGEVSHD